MVATYCTYITVKPASYIQTLKLEKTAFHWGFFLPSKPSEPHQLQRSEMFPPSVSE